MKYGVFFEKKIKSQFLSYLFLNVPLLMSTFSDPQKKKKNENLLVRYMAEYEGYGRIFH